MDFYNDPEKVDEYEKMCEGYDGSELYDFLEKYLTEGSSLLELGSGPGNDIEYLRHKYHVTASDLSDEFLTRCKKRFQGLEVLTLDALSLDTEKKFDCLFSNKVLHHLPKEQLENSLKRQQEVIEKKWKGVHNFTPSYRKDCYPEFYFGEHPEEIEDSMPELLERLNLEIECEIEKR